MCVYVYHVQGEPIRAAVQAVVAVSTVPDLRTTKPKEKKGQSKHRNLMQHALCIIVSYSIGIGPSKEQTFTPKSDHRKRKKGLSRITSLRFKTLTNAVLIFRAFKAANPAKSKNKRKKGLKYYYVAYSFLPRVMLATTFLVWFAQSVESQFDG